MIITKLMEEDTYESDRVLEGDGGMKGGWGGVGVGVGGFVKTYFLAQKL